MSKRIESKKTAVFTLGPDGFSSHTFELSKRLTKHEYHHMKDKLYRLQEQPGEGQWIYQEKKGLHHCIRFRKYGIRTITFEHIKSKAEFDLYYLRMIVNPRLLIEPGCSYLGILPPEKSSIEKLQKAFRKLFENTIFDNDINNYYLSRLDLCTNIRCDNTSLFRELVRVLRKLPTPPKYERKFYEYKYKGKRCKKEVNKYNKHYLRFGCGTHELVIYDKTYQIREGNLIVDYEDLPNGVLRFEVHCEREYIRKVQKKSDGLDTLGLLWQMIEECEDRLVDHFSRCFADTKFMRMGKLENRIKKSKFKGENKETMLELAVLLQRIQSVDKALDNMEKKGMDTSSLLDRFAKLGISPIPLRKKFCAESLPGPVELLRSVVKGAVEVEYVKAKYK